MGASDRAGHGSRHERMSLGRLLPLTKEGRRHNGQIKLTTHCGEELLERLTSGTSHLLPFLLGYGSLLSLFKQSRHSVFDGSGSLDDCCRTVNPDGDERAVRGFEAIGPRPTYEFREGVVRVVCECNGANQLEADLKLFRVALIAGGLLVPAPLRRLGPNVPEPTEHDAYYR